MDILERLLARTEITETKARYCLALDSKDMAGLEAVFVPDATLDSSEALSVRDPVTGAFDRPLYAGKASGSAAIARFILDSVHTFRTCHQVHTPIMDFISDTEAQVLWAMEDNLYCASGDPFLSMHGLGHYHEVLSQTGRHLASTVASANPTQCRHRCSREGCLNSLQSDRATQKGQTGSFLGLAIAL
jgi:hypothetical protein